MPRIPWPRGREKKQGQDKPEKTEPSEFEKICGDPKLAYELIRLPFEQVLDERCDPKVLLLEAKQYEDSGDKDKARESYRKLATLTLLRTDIRAKVDPTATDISLAQVRTYLEKVSKLGYTISYDAIMKYPEKARQAASDHLKGYQPKALEVKKTTDARDLKR